MENGECTFYEAMSGISLGWAAYRELLLTDSEQSSRNIKYFRPRSWAIFCCRVHEVSSKKEEALAMDDAKMLLWACGSGGPGQHRYDRVIIVQRGEKDDVAGTVQFFRKWLPEFVEERRLFLASVPENLEQGEVERAVGAADPIDCP